MAWLVWRGQSIDRGEQGEDSAYVKVRQRGKPYALAVLDDRSAGAMQVDVDVVTFMHAELAAFDDEDAVLDASDVGWAGDSTTEEQRCRDVVDGDAGERCGCRGGNGEVEDAV